MHDQYSWRGVLVVSLLYTAPAILALCLTVSVPGTIAGVGLLTSLLVRRAPTERWFERVGLGPGTDGRSGP